MTIPLHLQCMPMTCFYCPANGIGHITVADLEGIIYCERHRVQAEDDCNSHLHDLKQVRLTDAQRRFEDLFAAIPATFSVLRSSGALDEGWSVPVDAIHRLLTIKGTEWHIPVEKVSERIGRGIPLSALPVDPALLASVVAVLDAGFYKS